MNERWQCKHSDVYVKTDPPISVSTHSSQTLPQVLASESFFNSQEENTKFYFLYQGPPNTQRVNSKCNLSSISHISLKSIITEALTRKSFLCIVGGLWYKMSPLNMEDQDYSTGFGTLSLSLSLPLWLSDTQREFSPALKISIFSKLQHRCSWSSLSRILISMTFYFPPQTVCYQGYAPSSGFLSPF